MRLRQGDEHEGARATTQPKQSDLLIIRDQRDLALILDRDLRLPSSRPWTWHPLSNRQLRTLGTEHPIYTQGKDPGARVGITDQFDRAHLADSDQDLPSSS